MNKSEIFFRLEKYVKDIVPFRYHHLFTPLKRTISPHFAKTFSNIWCITWKCNFACAYCWQREGPSSFSDNTIPYREWLNAWMRISQLFDRVTVGITGGEPFLYKDFIRLLMELPDNITYDITSNISLLNVEEFLSHEKIRKQCSGISCSFHPSNASNSRDYIHSFFDKAKKLAILPGTKVNFVPADSNLPFYELLKDLCKKYNLTLHVKKHITLNPLSDNTPVEDDRGHAIRSPDSGLGGRSAVREEIYCSAGYSHSAFFPNGDVWPCYTKAALGEGYLGNVLSKEFKFNAGYKNCSYYPSCWRVDYHNVRVTKTNEKSSRSIPKERSA